MRLTRGITEPDIKDGFSKMCGHLRSEFPFFRTQNRMKRFQSKVQDLILGVFTQVPQQETDDLSRSGLDEGRIDMSTEPEYQQDGDDKDLQLDGFTCC